MKQVMRDHVSTTYKCSECGSTDLEVEVWMHLNNNEVHGDAGDTAWCPECEEHSKHYCLIEDVSGKCQYHPTQEDREMFGCFQEEKK